jgi:AcrR family transcriptional regulator
MKGRARPGARARKRDAITTAARSVFARDGYSRASIEAIAGRADVSTRTIYNHFESKEQLFAAVLEASAAQVADTFVATVERELGGTDVTDDTVALGLALLSARARFPEHFAMVRQINAETRHFPHATIDAWQNAGPRRIEEAVAQPLEQLAERGWLHVEQPRRAAAHFIAITAAEITGTSSRHLPRPSAADLREQVEAGVDAFINGYGTGGR